MAKSTHIGTCQVCGRSQKLPNGLLSKHGYTVEWGFFSGECYGSGNLPFEVSKYMIDDSIRRATQQRDETLGLSDEYKAGRLDDGIKAWVHAYYSSTGYGRNLIRGGYRWQQVDVVPVEKGMRGRFMYLDDNGKKIHIETYDYTIESLEQTRVHMNKQHAEYSLDKRVVDLNRYIAWQQQRIENWSPVALTPIEPVAV